MNIVISKSQYKKIVKESTLDSKLNFFKRRYASMVDHLKEIIYEGLWHYDLCDYKDFKEFYDMIVVSSVETFIYSYDELGGYNDDSMKEFLEKFTRDKFGNYIRRKWNERECDENTLKEQKSDFLIDKSSNELLKATGIRTQQDYQTTKDVIKTSESEFQNINSMTMEEYREKMYSVPSTFIMTLFSYFKYTKPIPIVAFGVLLIDDINQCVEKECDWLNILIDSLCIVASPAVSSSMKITLAPIINSSKSLIKNIPKFISYLCKKVKTFSPWVEKIAEILGTISTKIQEIINFLLSKNSPKFMKTLGGWLKSSISTVTSKLTEWKNALLKGYKMSKQVIKKKVVKPTQKVSSKVITKKGAIATTKAGKDAAVDQAVISGSQVLKPSEIDLTNVQTAQSDIEAAKKIQWQKK